MEKTTERVSREYYWVGIINTVRRVLHSCDSCVARGIRCSGNPIIGSSNPMVTISNQENGIKVEMEMGEEPDVFFVAHETCSYFWQRVHWFLDIYGNRKLKGTKKGGEGEALILEEEGTTWNIPFCFLLKSSVFMLWCKTFLSLLSKLSNF